MVKKGVEIGKLPSGQKIKYTRPDIWENKTKEEIKNALLNILNTEGVEPFVKNSKGNHSSILEFIKKHPEYTYQEIELFIFETVKNNIDEIVDFIYNRNSKNIIFSKDDNSIWVDFYAKMYSWSKESFDKDYFYKYYYQINIF